MWGAGKLYDGILDLRGQLFCRRICSLITESWESAFILQLHLRGCLVLRELYLADNPYLTSTSSENPQRINPADILPALQVLDGVSHANRSYPIIIMLNIHQLYAVFYIFSLLPIPTLMFAVFHTFSVDSGGPWVNCLNLMLRLWDRCRPLTVKQSTYSCICYYLQVKINIHI